MPRWNFLSARERTKSFLAILVDAVVMATRQPFVGGDQNRHLLPQRAMLAVVEAAMPGIRADKV